MFSKFISDISLIAEFVIIIINLLIWIISTWYKYCQYHHRYHHSHHNCHHYHSTHRSVEFVLDIRCQWSISFFTIFSLKCKFYHHHHHHINSLLIINSRSLRRCEDLWKKRDRLTRCKCGEKYAKGEHPYFPVKYSRQPDNIWFMTPDKPLFFIGRQPRLSNSIF